MASTKIQFKDFEKLSEYYDGESLKPETIKVELGLVNNGNTPQNVITCFEFTSHLLKHSFDSEEAFANLTEKEDEFCKSVLNKINQQDNLLKGALDIALGKLPQELKEFDLWNSLEEKLDTESTIPATSTSTPVNTLVQFPLKNDEVKEKRTTWNLTNLLKESYKLPSEIENASLWNSINEKLDSIYHKEIFSESLDESYSGKERYLVGLSEFIDGEVSASKANKINEHLLQCSDCRRTYLSLCKQKQAIKESFANMPILDENKLWEEIERKLFPEDNLYIFRKKAA